MPRRDRGAGDLQTLGRHDNPGRIEFGESANPRRRKIVAEDADVLDLAGKVVGGLGFFIWAR